MKPLQLNVLNFPVYIAPTFWLLAGVIGMLYSNTPMTGAGISANLGPIFIYGVAVFLSILVHELGHALAWRRYGHAPQILLHGMGGRTSVQVARDRMPGPKQRLVVTLAGPGFGLALGLSIVGLTQGLSMMGLWPDMPLLSDFAMAMIWINIGWSIFNMVPLLPLDGGHAVEAAVSWAGKDGRKVALWVSVLSAAGFLALAATSGDLFFALIAFMFGGQSVRELATSYQATRDKPLFQELQRDFELIRLGDAQKADAFRAAARDFTSRSSLPQWTATIAVMWMDVAMNQGEVDDAAEAFLRLPQGANPPEAMLRRLLADLRSDGSPDAYAKAADRAHALTGDARYTLDGARAHMRTGELAEAAGLLLEAIEGGATNLWQVEHDEEFEPLVSSDVWEELKAEVRDMAR